VPQLARVLGVTPHWVYHQSKRGTITIGRDARPGLSLCPDQPETLEVLERLRQGHLTAMGD